MMHQRSRVLLAVAALALLAVYVWPLWHIQLEAPQYPEGLGLYIEVNTIRGEHPGNLASINGLNHYIGMKSIEPDAIPELDLLPWVFGVLIGFGLLGVVLGHRWLLVAWVVLFGLVIAAGLFDFYLWEYDYGHNLDVERAIIKVPGMTYQPPLIGSKQMLNITARSWPALGGWIAFAGFLLGLVTVFFELRKPRLEVA